ncbi:hypothetical protein [Paractinoplanes atraurantiacus]|uniref:Uncharacterized protein n=1 Tax=Paractinoplanes atraurantiacus TaxID=1036182 RepID=A0A285KPJ5_9ACTN|nr:hypothetical protein [Actinoplanes atraurantiacus]SNY74133.1 hypothetical protein SAMN05421748_15026 [Actinoplanes atraurantiacus]
MSDESVSPLDTRLFPDLAERGGLGPAWRDAARRAGADLDEISWPDGFFRLNSASIPVEGGRIDLETVRDQRLFFMHISVGSHPWLWGGSDDLEQLARAAAIWRDGSTIRAMIAAFPFLETSRFVQARENGQVAIWCEGGGYEVSTSWRGAVRPAATPAEAVRLAVEEMPS